MRLICVLTATVALMGGCFVGCIPASPTDSKPDESPSPPAQVPAQAPGAAAPAPAPTPEAATPAEADVSEAAPVTPQAEGSGTHGLVVSLDDQITGGAPDFQLPKVRYDPQEDGAVIHFTSEIGEPGIRLQGAFRRIGPRTWEMTGAFEGYAEEFRPGEPVINVMGEYLPFQQNAPYAEQTPNVLVMIPASPPPPGTSPSPEKVVHPIKQTFTAPDYSIFAILLPPF